MVYLIGSLRNPKIPFIANELQSHGFDVFSAWHAAGPEADDMWKTYEVARGRSYIQALHGRAAINVFNFDKRHLAAATSVVLVAPAGKSGHMEFGWALGRGTPGFYLLEPGVDRWDVMLKFSTAVVAYMSTLVDLLRPIEKTAARIPQSLQFPQ